jgi:hypothetical protein
MNNCNGLNGQNSQDTLKKFNVLISQASDAVLCNSDCKREREAEQLKQKFTDAQANLASAPAQVYTTNKNYITFTEGESKYREIRTAELEKKAQEIIDLSSENFKQDEANLNIQIDSYDGLLLNFRNVIDLFDTYKKENTKLFLDLKDETNDVLTNERKTFYEDQRIDGLKFYYYYILLAIYIICVICFAAFSLIYPSQSTFKMRIAILIALIVLPYISSWILGNIIYLIYKAYGLLPKNVYL